MLLIDLLSRDRVRAGVCLSSKKRLLEKLSTLLSDDRDGQRTVFESLCNRERLGSTGLGSGVAIPHGRVAGGGEVAGAFLRLNDAIEFDAADNQPVDLVFALVVPEHFTDQHLQLLAQIAEMFSDAGFCGRLRAARDSDALYDLLSGWNIRQAAAL